MLRLMSKQTFGEKTFTTIIRYRSFTSCRFKLQPFPQLLYLEYPTTILLKRLHYAWFPFSLSSVAFPEAPLSASNCLKTRKNGLTPPRLAACNQIYETIHSLDP